MFTFSSGSLDLNRFLLKLSEKKQYFNKLKNQVSFLSEIKEYNYKILHINLKTQKKQLKNLVVMYIFDIYFSRSNTILTVLDCFGNVKFFYSAGILNYKGRAKISRSIILKNFLKILLFNLKFFKNKPIGVHLKNVGLKNLWFLKKLRQKFFIVTVKSFSLYPYNGCRRKKVRRKKFKLKKYEEMAERFKATDCKSVEFLIIGSNPIFFRFLFEI